MAYDESPTRVVGPDGRLLTLDDLPDPKTKRWVPQRKAEVVAAVNGGLLTLAEACKKYGLSVEEFEGWAKSIKNFGVKGLRATRTQHYRSIST